MSEAKSWGKELAGEGQQKTKLLYPEHNISKMSVVQKLINLELCFWRGNFKVYPFGFRKDFFNTW